MYMFLSRKHFPNYFPKSVLLYYRGIFVCFGEADVGKHLFKRLFHHIRTKINISDQGQKTQK